jgi:hypothetical protein
MNTDTAVICYIALGIGVLLVGVLFGLVVSA